MNAFLEGLQGLQVAPNVGGGLDALASSQSALGASVKRIGVGLQRIGQDIQEEIKRQDAMNSIRATAAYTEHFQKFFQEQNQIRHTDGFHMSRHHEIPGMWESGWDSPDGTHQLGAKQLKEQLAKGFRTESARQEWLAKIESVADPKFRKSAQDLASDLREEYASTTLPYDLSVMVISGIEDAEAAHKMAQGMFLPNEWAKVGHYSDAQIALKLAESNPDSDVAKQYIEKYIVPAHRDEVIQAIAANRKAAEVREEKARKDQIEATEAQTTIRVFKTIHGRAEPDEQITPSNLDTLLGAGLIGETRYTALMTLLQKQTEDLKNEQVAKESRASSLRAYRVMAKEKSRLLAGGSYERFNAILDQYMGNLDKEDCEAMLDFAESVRTGKIKPEDKVLGAAMEEANDMATKAIVPFFRDAKGNQYDPAKSPEPPKLAEAVGGAMRELESWVAVQTRGGKPLDVNAFRVERDRVIERLCQQVYAQQNSQDPTRAPAIRYDDMTMSKARIEILSEPDPKKRVNKLFFHAPGLGNTEAENLRKFVFDPASTVVNGAVELNAKIQAIRNVQIPAMTSQIEKDAMNAKLIWVQDQILRQLEKNPELAPRKQRELIDSGLAAVRNEAAEETIKHRIWKIFTPYPYGSWMPHQAMNPMPESAGSGTGSTMVPEDKAKKEPTAAELWQKNTREAYEQGKALGYWK